MECENCKKMFIDIDAKKCPYCGHNHIKIIDIAF